MKTILAASASILALTFSVAQARDDYPVFPVKDAIAKGQTTKDRLDPNIPLLFGKKTPAVDKRLGEYSSSKATNAVNKSDKEACEIAFVSAALSLQQRARREGGDAVINIVSLHPGQPGDADYVCHAGTFSANVGLRGTVVKLKPGKK